MKLKLLAWILVISVLANATMVFGQNYIYTTEWDTGNQNELLTANTTLTVTVPTNASYNSAYLDIVVSVDSDVKVVDASKNQGWLYQEAATSTSYFPTTSDYNQTIGFLYYNYTKPAYAYNASWEVKHGNGPIRYNATILSTCYAQTPVQLRFVTTILGATLRSSAPQCYNGTTWNTIGVNVTGTSFPGSFTGTAIPTRFDDGDWNTFNAFYLQVENISSWITTAASTWEADVYETAMWWEVYPYPVNVTVLVNGLTTANYSNVFNTSRYAIDLNVTYINTYTDSNGTVPITINAGDWGNSSLKVNTTFEYEDIWVCNGSDWQQTSYNFSIYDEDNITRLTGDISIDLTYGSSVLSYEEEDTHSLAICTGGSTNYTISGTVYSDVEYRHKHFLNDAVFTATQNDVRLYNFPDGMTGLTDLEWTSRDSSYSFYKNLIVKMQRYYPANHSWVVVQQDKSGEFGNSIFQIYQSDVDYRFYFYDSSGTFLDSTTSVKFVCDVGEACKVENQVIPTATPARDINSAWAFDNQTKILTVNWNDPTGATSAVYISFVRLAVPDDIIICNTTVYSTAGSYTCNATGYIGNAMLTVRSSGSPWYVSEKSIINLYGAATLANFISITESAVWTFGFVLTIAAMGVTGAPVAVVILTLVSLWIMSLIGISSVTTVSFIGIATVMGLTIAVIIGRKK